jgi:predicted nucleotidyltransferase
VLPEELAAAMVRRVRAEHERQAERGQRLIVQLRREILDLRATGSLDAAWLIGSLAWGGFGNGSDVDVVVRGSDPARIGALWGHLSDALDIDVDVLRLEDMPDAFRDRVLASGRRLDEP